MSKSSGMPPSPLRPLRKGRPVSSPAVVVAPAVVEADVALGVAAQLAHDGRAAVRAAVDEGVDGPVLGRARRRPAYRRPRWCGNRPGSGSRLPNTGSSTPGRGRCAPSRARTAPRRGAAGTVRESSRCAASGSRSSSSTSLQQRRYSNPRTAAQRPFASPTISSRTSVISRAREAPRAVAMPGARAVGAARTDDARGRCQRVFDPGDVQHLAPRPDRLRGGSGMLASPWWCRQSSVMLGDHVVARRRRASAAPARDRCPPRARADCPPCRSCAASGSSRGATARRRAAPRSASRGRRCVLVEHAKHRPVRARIGGLRHVAPRQRNAVAAVHRAQVVRADRHRRSASRDRARPWSCAASPPPA